MNYICRREKKFRDFFLFRKIVRVHLIAKMNMAKIRKKKFATILRKSEIFAEKKRFNFFHVQKINGKFREWNEKF